MVFVGPCFLPTSSPHCLLAHTDTQTQNFATLTYNYTEVRTTTTTPGSSSRTRRRSSSSSATSHQLQHSSSPMCKVLEKSTLLLLDVIDGLAGLLLFIYGGYLSKQLDPRNAEGDDTYSWLCIPVLCLAGWLLLTAILSFVGSNFDRMRCLLLLSAVLGLIGGIVELLLLVVLGVLKGKVKTWVRNHKAELGLTENDLTTLDSLYAVFLWCLAVLCLLEIVRYQVSKHLRRQLHVDYLDYEVRLLEAREHEARGRATDPALRREEEVKQKYRMKRAAYITKHSRGGGEGSGRGGGGGEGEEEEEGAYTMV